MEYKILEKIQKLGFPKWLKIVIAVALILIGIIFAIAPIFPGLIFIIIGVAMLISGKKVGKLIKIRKGMVYLFKNFSWQRVKYKINDFKTHIKEIIFHK